MDVLQFGKAKKEGFATFLKLPNDIDWHDTFGRVVQLIGSKMQEKVCIDWLQSIAGQVQGVVAIEGKSLRGSRHGAQGPLHIVSAWACQASTCSGRCRRTRNPTKSPPFPSCSNY